MRCLTATGAIALVAGCAGSTHYSASPHVSVRTGISASIDRIGLDPPLSVWLRVRARDDVRVRRVLLTPAVAEPCHEGLRETVALVDGERQWARPFDVSGDHEVSLSYGSFVASELLAKPTALDLVIAGDADRPDECLRVELTSRDPRLAWKSTSRGTTGGSLRLLVPVQGVDGVGTGWSIDARVGGYAGPVRLMGEVGVGTAHCGIRCFSSDVGFLWLPLGVSAHTFLAESHDFVLDLGLAYKFVPAFVSYREDGRTVPLHAPELRLRFASPIQRGPGLPSGARTGNGGIEVIASEWFADGPNGPERAFVLGLGLVWETGF